MSTRHSVKVRGGVAAVAAVVLAITVAGCGGGDDKPKAAPGPSPAKSQGDSSKPQAPSGEPKPAPTEVLATVNGEQGMTLTINSAVRDAGGFLTISGQLKNTGSQAFGSTAAWRGNELNSSGSSVAGVTLVDKAGKKRYYVLRDTEGRCLCTTGLTIIEAGQTVPFFAQFPVPPTSTNQVDFNMPTFATATVKLSG
ncbi:hypothetical protein [Streptomyces lavendulae]|uniref:hypothetical protein n=1 Tax=Streptomyces lavendulae TaxID=1914 RepID=UPI00249FFCE7|nr:hypothetical protein [Streptomyces lavendulae]GLX17832.1 hypothetical protein Slala01_14760 [Streptomyces lavendulae subsp. lavendulae]GLX26176.1 hypothetical protein Slala02_19960 [Streptomyces lavendulae subsp. lavendulae]